MTEVRKKPFRLTAPKAFVPKEFDEQVAVFEYAEIAARQDARWHLLFATLNGVRLPISLAVKMKRAGNRAHVPDICLPVSVTESAWHPHYCGLWIEMKRIKGGVLSDGQDRYHCELRKQGYKVVVAKGAKEAIKMIAQYLDQK